MNFFEHQERARKRTTLLAFLFILATLITLVLTNLVALVTVAVLTTGNETAHYTSFWAWVRTHPKIVFWTSFGVLAFIGAASMYRMASLGSGGKAVAMSLGGVRVDHDTTDPQKRQLLNLVEEMAIAAGVPVPQVYVLEQEPGINAFAAGFTPSDAAIAVTRGTIENLTRDELQGVIAHEFSHVFNGDMRLNTRLLGVVYGILVIGLVGRLILRALRNVRTSGSRRKGGGQFIAVAFLAGLALTVIGYIGLLFASMIRAAVSRQREFLADASAVQFTRNPDGIAGALKKIAVSPLRSVLQAADSEEVGHMLIADGRKMFQSFFATHPPIFDRIRKIDKRFTTADLDRIKLAPPQETTKAAASPAAAAFAFSPALIIAAIGNPGELHIQAAAQQAAAIPDALRRAAHSHALAPAVVLTLALSKDAAERTRQIAKLRERLPEAQVKHLEAVVTMAQALSPEQRLPLIEMAFPILRERSAEEMQRLIAAIDEIARMDGHFDVLEYGLVRLLRVQLTDAAKPQALVTGNAKLHSLRDEASVLFSVLAQAGDRDKYVARRAYEAGMRQLLGANAPPFSVPTPWVAPLDRALNRLDSLAPLAKQALLEALVATIVHDRQVSLGEIEMLRVICASLHCPVPPIQPMQERLGAAGVPHAAA